VPGSPTYLSDGRVLIGGELAHDGYDARCLFADGGLLTPASLYVRRVCGRLGADLLVEASDGEPSEQHLYRVGTRSGAPTVEVNRLTTDPGWHVGYSGGDTFVVGSRSLDHAGVWWTVHSGPNTVGRIGSLAALPPYAPRPALERVTDRRLPTGVLYPRSHVSGRKLPVLVDIYGGPGHQEVVPPATCGCAGSGGPMPASRSWSSTTGARPGWRPRSRRSCTGGWPTSC
jgi:dipeptidyl-peptidase-4